ncbi:MAG: alanine--tRNA ligase [Capsulimonadaceae bacterium]
MLGSEIRRRYLEFFESKGALRMPSDSLVTGDPTLLFTVAGMVPMVPFFLGEQVPPRNSVTTVQKCLRTKDIDDIGDTSHCTFFEMLGNFSFGGYFKPEAVAWAWEFLFDILGLDIDRVRVTIYKDDEDAFDLWRAAGMPERKIFRFDQDSNYWPANVITDGPNTACGPCSEIFYDTQPNLPATPDGVWDDKRWLEIWNLVFTQFKRGDGGVLTPLPKKNIDTGMGLERTAAVLMDVRGPYETDLFAPTLARLQEISGKVYTRTDDSLTDIAFRRIADHVRATTFLIGDGVLPSNNAQGYVLRRLMRRAMLAGRRTLGIEKPFLAEAIPAIIEQYQDVYPEVLEKRDTILRHAANEEDQFRKTLSGGSARFESIVFALAPGDTVSGKDVFDLATTYGFPVEMTAEIAREKGLTVDLAQYDDLLAQHEIISRGDTEKQVMVANVAIQKLRAAGVAETVFLGYTHDESTSRIAGMVAGGGVVDSARQGDEVRIVLERTPFYAAAGGQIGDIGWLHGTDGAFDVTDTQKESGYWFHIGVVTAGVLRVGDAVDARIDAPRRGAIRRNHTATHLLQSALQEVLGSHVHQRGSLVAPDRLRFDFSHDSAMTDEQIREVEGIVNEKILDDLPVHTFEKPIAEAKKMGAMMLFGEKYGDIVRVVQTGDYSLEFCGGTHLQHTSQAGIFKVASESSSQAGVRRIEAVTGKAALMRTLDQERLLSTAAATLKTTPVNVVPVIEKLQAQLRDSERELAQLQRAAAGNIVVDLVAGAREIGGVKVVTHLLEFAPDAEALRTMADEVLNRLRSGVVILGADLSGKVSLAVKVSKDQVDRGVHAGNIVREAAKVVGGGGGGRPDFAQAGGKDPSKLPDALSTAERLVVAAGA